MIPLLLTGQHRWSSYVHSAVQEAVSYTPSEYTGMWVSCNLGFFKDCEELF